MLNILIINWRDIKNPEAGGAEVHLHEISRRMAARGHMVTVLASGWEGAPAEEVVDGVRVVRRGGKFAFNYHVPGASRALLARDGFDIVVDDINKIPFYTPVYIRKPILALAHHLFAETIFLETAFPLATYVYLSEALIPLVYKKTKFVAVSDSTRDDLVRRGIPRANISVVYNAVDHDRYTPGDHLKAPEPLLAYLGRIKRYKRIDLVLAAAKRVFERFPSARLVIVGSGDGLPELVRLAGRLGIGDRVEFTGFVTEDRKIEILRQAHVVLNPSSKEGWGVTVTEANACGTPVVASNVPGLRDAVLDGKTGFLVNYGDVQGFAERVSAILANDALRNQLSEAAVAWAREFNWDRSADSILSVIADMVRTSQRS
ncbi:MAG TPA: glycosyltransferase family 4 protein [bacterium]|nr:glycosyltransferase family 4 protein [bacterium]